MVVREPLDWSTFFAGAIGGAVVVLVVAALAVAVVRPRADRSRDGRD